MKITTGQWYRLANGSVVCPWSRDGGSYVITRTNTVGPPHYDGLLDPSAFVGAVKVQVPPVQAPTPRGLESSGAPQTTDRSRCRTQ
jgi:hypothetical protein